MRPENQVDRADPRMAREIYERLLGPINTPAAQALLRFSAASTDYLERYHPERWSVTLFAELFRLNGGWVECLVLRPEGVELQQNAGFPQAHGLRTPSASSSS